MAPPVKAIAVITEGKFQQMFKRKYFKGRNKFGILVFLSAAKNLFDLEQIKMGKRKFITQLFDFPGSNLVVEKVF